MYQCVPFTFCWNTQKVLSSFLSLNQPNISVLVLALILLRFGIFALLHYWHYSWAGLRHIFLKKTTCLGNLHFPVFSMVLTLLCLWFMFFDKVHCSECLGVSFAEIKYCKSQFRIRIIFGNFFVNFLWFTNSITKQSPVISIHKHLCLFSAIHWYLKAKQQRLLCVFVCVGVPHSFF